MAFEMARRLIDGVWRTVAADEAGSGSAEPDLPIADPTGVTVDTSTYDNPFTGSGKLTTLVFPAFSDTGLLAVAVEGEAFPRILMSTDLTDGWYFADGSVDPRSGNAMALFLSRNAGDGSMVANFVSFHGDFDVGRADAGGNRGFVDGHALGVVINRLNGSVMVTTVNGVPNIGGEVGDLAIRADGVDGSWIYRCTVAGAAGAATWVAKL